MEHFKNAFTDKIHVLKYVFVFCLIVLFRVESETKMSAPKASFQKVSGTVSTHTSLSHTQTHLAAALVACLGTVEILVSHLQLLLHYRCICLDVFRNKLLFYPTAEFEQFNI